MSNERKKTDMRMIHSCIGVAIMLFFGYLPISLPEVTEVGMRILGIFIGTLYLWTAVDSVWPSILCVFLIGTSGYSSMSAVLSSFFGNVTIVQLFFVMVLIAILVFNKVTVYIGRFFLTRKVINGRPWLFTFMVLLGAYVMAAFVYPFAPIFLFWPIMYGIFAELGFNKEDKYPKIILILIVLVALLGFSVAPYMATPLALLSNYRQISGNPTMVNDAMYLIFTIAIGMAILTAMVLFSKYVLKPDVTPLKNISVEHFEKNPLPPMSTVQKITGIVFVGYIFMMLLPTLLPSVPGMAFLSANANGMALICIAALGAITVKGNKVMEFSKVMEKDFAWPTFFLVSAAVLLGSVLTGEQTGISAFLAVTLSPIFMNMSSMQFTIALLLICICIKPFCNSLVIGMILQTVVLTYCNMTGTYAAPILTLLIFTVLSTVGLTPASSPFAAVLFANKEWLPLKDIYKYSAVFLILQVLIVLCIGIPMAMFLM